MTEVRESAACTLLKKKYTKSHVFYENHVVCENHYKKYKSAVFRQNQRTLLPNPENRDCSKCFPSVV